MWHPCAQSKSSLWPGRRLLPMPLPHRARPLPHCQSAFANTWPQIRLHCVPPMPTGDVSSQRRCGPWSCKSAAASDCVPKLKLRSCFHSHDRMEERIVVVHVFFFLLFFCLLFLSTGWLLNCASLFTLSWTSALLSLFPRTGNPLPLDTPNPHLHTLRT